jgi:hypothetical protein
MRFSMGLNKRTLAWNLGTSLEHFETQNLDIIIHVREHLRAKSFE